MPGLSIMLQILKRSWVRTVIHVAPHRATAQNRFRLQCLRCSSFDMAPQPKQSMRPQGHLGMRRRAGQSLAWLYRLLRGGQLTSQAFQMRAIGLDQRLGDRWANAVAALLRLVSFRYGCAVGTRSMM